jgi:predicted RNase H-like HicB family nuclease
MLNKYTFESTWSEEEEQFIGLCKEFPFLSAFGETQEEAINEIKEVVDFNIGWMNEDGEKLPEPIGLKKHNGKLLLRLPVHVHGMVEKQAEINNISINQFLVSLISHNLYQYQIEQNVIQSAQILETMEKVCDQMQFQLQNNLNNVIDQNSIDQLDRANNIDSSNSHRQMLPMLEESGKGVMTA